MFSQNLEPNWSYLVISLHIILIQGIKKYISLLNLYKCSWRTEGVCPVQLPLTPVLSEACFSWYLGVDPGRCKTLRNKNETSIELESPQCRTSWTCFCVADPALSLSSPGIGDPPSRTRCLGGPGRAHWNTRSSLSFVNPIEGCISWRQRTGLSL